MNPPFYLTVSGADTADPALRQDLRDALAGDVEPAATMGGLHDLLRLAVDWGPHAALWATSTLIAGKPALDAAKTAIEIVEKLLGLLRRRPGLVIRIPSREGPIEVTGATKEQVAALIAAHLTTNGTPPSDGNGHERRR